VCWSIGVRAPDWHTVEDGGLVARLQAQRVAEGGGGLRAPSQLLGRVAAVEEGACGPEGSGGAAWVWRRRKKSSVALALERTGVGGHEVDGGVERGHGLSVSRRLVQRIATVVVRVGVGRQHS
jgi:hypothetical protein